MCKGASRLKFLSSAHRYPVIIQFVKDAVHFLQCMFLATSSKSDGWMFMDLGGPPGLCSLMNNSNFLPVSFCIYYHWFLVELEIETSDAFNNVLLFSIVLVICVCFASI